MIRVGTLKTKQSLMCSHRTTEWQNTGGKTELQGEINKSIIIVRDFNTPLREMDRFSRQKISKDQVELNSTINQLDIIDIYR